MKFRCVLRRQLSPNFLWLLWLLLALHFCNSLLTVASLLGSTPLFFTRFSWQSTQFTFSLSLLCVPCVSSLLSLNSTKPMACIDFWTLSSTAKYHNASVASLAQQGCVGFWSFAGFAGLAVQVCFAGLAVPTLVRLTPCCRSGRAIS